MSQTNNQSQSDYQVATSYRLVQKKYFCHVCSKDFKKMSSVNELTEVECPDCHQTFCEEIAN